MLDDIAAEAGCAKGSLYLEFPGKQALYFAVMDDVHAEVGARVRAAVDGVTSPAEWLRISVRFTFDTLEREPLLARLLRDDPDLRARRLSGRSVLTADDCMTRSVHPVNRLDSRLHGDLRG